MENEEQKVAAQIITPPAPAAPVSQMQREYIAQMKDILTDTPC